MVWHPQGSWVPVADNTPIYSAVIKVMRYLVLYQSISEREMQIRRRQQGIVCFVTMYHKGFRKMSHIKIIHRYVPREVGKGANADARGPRPGDDGRPRGDEGGREGKRRKEEAAFIEWFRGTWPSGSPTGISTRCSGPTTAATRTRTGMAVWLTAYMICRPGMGPTWPG